MRLLILQTKLRTANWKVPGNNIPSAAKERKRNEREKKMKKKRSQRLRFLSTIVMTVAMVLSMAAPVSAAGPSFDDVSPTAYYANAVGWGADEANGITSGTTATTFSPDAPCTRAQIVTFLYRYAGTPSMLSSDAFNDVSSGHYAYNAINWANYRGITSGTGNNNFSPEQTCTRAQIVTFLYREYGNNEIAAASGFDDASGYAYDAINWAAAHNITSGVGQNHFGSSQPCTRAQAITFLYRYNTLTRGFRQKSEAGKVYRKDNSKINVPAYNGSPYVAVNNNVPFFTASDNTTSSFETYGDFDSLGRCTAAYACIGQELMPTEPRGEIGMVKPTGWHTVKYPGIVNGNYLYNRCHLIGYQLTAENANEKNLITGTRYMNVEGMEPFENMVADYIKETGNHVLYRVTPMFEGNNLLASGVLMEAKSVEDGGAGVQFCVYCYNVQPGITINYANGDSAVNGQQPTATPTVAPTPKPTQAPTSTPKPADAPTAAPTQTPTTSSYVVNINSKVFHRPDCSSVGRMSAENRRNVTESRSQLISEGYSPCKICNP